jgi:hypothetical protein
MDEPTKGTVVIVPLPEDDWTAPLPETMKCEVCHNRRVIIAVDNTVKHCPVCTLVDGRVKREQR